MIAHYKSTYRAYILCMIMGSVLSMGLFLLTASALGMWAFCVMAGVLFGALTVGMSLAKKRHAQIQAILLERCDPAAFIQTMRSDMRLNAMAAPDNLHHLAAGYLYCGDAAGLTGILRDAAPYVEGGLPPAKAFNQFRQCHLQVDLFLLTGQLAQAEAALQAMRRQLEEQGARMGVSLAEAQSRLRQLEMDVALAQGQYAAVRGYFAEQCQTATQMLYRVQAALSLGRACLGMGDGAAAVEPVRFAAQNGGSTRFAREAAALLAKTQTA